MPLITFDLDGTLVDSPFGKVVFPWIEGEFRKVSDVDALALIRAEQRKRFTSGKRVEGLHWDDIVKTVAAETGVPWPHSLPEIMRGERLGPQFRELAFYDDVPDALTALKAAGYRFAVLTNGHVIYQKPIFDHMGVTELFEDLVGPDVTGRVKPDPEAFSHPALRGAVWHVGDLLAQDVRAARRAGVRPVLIARPGAAAPGLLKLASLSPVDRVQEALRLGLLADEYALECEQYGIFRVPDLVPDRAERDTVPDAIIYSFGELPDLFGLSNR